MKNLSQNYNINSTSPPPGSAPTSYLFELCKIKDLKITCPCGGLVSSDRPAAPAGAARTPYRPGGGERDGFAPKIHGSRFRFGRLIGSRVPAKKVEIKYKDNKHVTIIIYSFFFFHKNRMSEKNHRLHRLVFIGEKGRSTANYFNNYEIDFLMKKDKLYLKLHQNKFLAPQGEPVAPQGEGGVGPDPVGLIPRARKTNKTTQACARTELFSLKINLWHKMLGVSHGFRFSLSLKGTGYSFILRDDSVLTLSLGFSHLISLKIPNQVNVELLSPTQIILSSSDLLKVSQWASKIRDLKNSKKDIYNKAGLSLKNLTTPM